METKKKKSSNRHPVALSILEMVFTLLSIPLCMLYGIGVLKSSPEEFTRVLQTALLFIGLMRLFRSLGNRYRRPNHLVRRLDLACAPVLFVCVVVLGFSRNNPDAQLWICRLFLIMVLAGRAVSVVNNHKWNNIVQNVVLACVTVFLSLDLWSKNSSGKGMAWIILIAAAISLLNVLSFAFDRIRLDVLRNIVQNTYAVEIISGLLMLIMSFSWILVIVEDGIHSYKDALWYCFALVTTIGFGDISAASDLGRVLSVVLGIYGIIVVSLITSIIVNFYGETRKTSHEEEPEEKHN